MVADSTPLNYLAILSDFDLLRGLYGALVIPPAVHEEVVTRGAGYPVHDACTVTLGTWISMAS